MIFKSVTSSITRSGYALSVFGKEWSVLKAELSNAQGLGNKLKAVFGGITVPAEQIKADRLALSNYFNAIKTGTNETDAFNTHMATASTTAQDLAKKVGTGAITIQEANAALNATSISAKVAALGIKALSFAMNTLISMGISLVITAIISGIFKLVNMQEELRKKAVDSANALKEQNTALADLKQQYLDIADGEDTLAKKTEALNEWKKTLIDTYGFEEEALRNVNTERQTGIDLLNAEADADANKYLSDNRKQIEKATKKIDQEYNYTVGIADIPQEALDLFDNVEKINDYGSYEVSFNADNKIEAYEKISKIVDGLVKKEQTVGKLTENEQYLLENLIKERDKLGKVVDKYGETYTQSINSKATLKYNAYAKENLEPTGAENYESWKQGLLDTAGSDTEIAEALAKIAEEQFADLEKRVQTIAKARDIFGLSNVNGSYDAEFNKQKEEFIKSLSDEDLAKIVQIPNAFANGIDGAKEALKGFTGTVGSSDTDVVTFDETLTAVSENLDILSAVQKDLTDDGRLSIDTMQKLSQAGLDYNTIVGTNGESLRDLIITQLDAEIATKRLALAQAQLNAQSAAMAGQDWSGFAETATQLANELAESENTKKIVIGTQYTPTEKEKKTKEEVPEQIQNFKNLESKYQHYVSIKKMSEEDFMAWYGNAYKNAYKGYENSEEYADDYRSAMEKVFTWEEDRHKDLFDKRIQSINNEIDLVIKTKTDFSGNELETKEYFRQLKDLYTQQIDETNLRINEVLEQGVIGNGEYLEELEKQKIEYTQKIEDLNKEAFESEKEYIESIKDAELKAIDEGIDKVKEEQKAKEEANQKEIDGIQAKIDAINEENDTKEKSNDLTQAELDLQQKLLNLEKAKSSYKRKIIGAGGNVEYAVDNEAVANAEKELKEARAKVADLKKQGEIDALEAQKEEAEKKKDSDNEGFETQINGLETEKETREKFYEDVVARLDKIINPDKQTESNSDTWEEVAKTDTTVSTDNGVTTVDGKEIPSSQNATSTNPQPTLRENDLLNNKNQPEQKQTFSPTTVNDYFKSMGINIPNVSDMVNMFPDITKSLFDNMLGNTSSSIANTSSIVNNDGGVVNTITVGDIVISNPVGNINDLSKELKTQLPSAIKKILAQ